YISIFCQNINSLYNKIDELTVILNRLTTKFQVIALLETRNIEHNIYKNLLPNYDNYYLKPKLNKCGGILLWIQQDYTHIERNDLTINNHTIDNIWIEITDNFNKYKLIIAIIYRHPISTKLGIKNFKMD